MVRLTSVLLVLCLRKLFNDHSWFGTLKKLICFYVFEKREIQSNAALSLSMKRFRIVAWMANKLYNEHYTVVPTKHQISNEGATKKK
jgi:hypothetical protein